MRRADDELSFWVSRVLGIGTALSMAVVLAGVALTLVAGGGAPSALGAGLPSQIVAWKPGSIVSIGLLLLVLTPAAELVAALVAFARSGERRYLIVTSLVLGLLAVGVLTASLVSQSGGG